MKIMVKQRQRGKRGAGILNTVINKLPFEAHIPGYQFAGPGTRLEKRLKRGDIGVNPLDAACRNHDIIYSKYKNLEDRHKADKVLEHQAWERVLAKDAKLPERVAAWSVTNAMKLKRKLGMGFKRVVHAAKLDKNAQQMDLLSVAKQSLKAARRVVRKKKIPLPRTINVPKTKGGVLPLIPIFAGLSALGALAGGAANVVKMATELSRKGNTAISMGKGFYLQPYKSGSGFKLTTSTKKMIRKNQTKKTKN
ncbi:uncharacterized protein LOC126909398 [Daktulosphaira vitifoliae]|uniref:uncharacterized protein LOC126908950 n=1 Tax=Daktulosphaira vitifoliae TaxID=58002 RepID=UPI0021AA596C|nr:uncharacterized protein LOC126908950 [Daktulosphaira vitifoliae]XP_050547774.1 uncharacterized protein LOC126909398 [Daktulosphaira vitifoliae]